MVKESGKPEDILKEICEIVDGPISAEVVALDWEGMVREGRELIKIHKNIVVKIPITKDGLKAVKALAGENIPIYRHGDGIVPANAVHSVLFLFIICPTNQV